MGAMMAEELKKEQDQSSHLERMKKNSMLNNAVLLIPLKLTENSSAESRKLLTKVKKTRRISLESKTSLTNFKSKSRPTNVKLKNLKNKPIPIFLNTANFNTNSMKLKNVLIWLNLPLISFAPKLVTL